MQAVQVRQGKGYKTTKVGPQQWEAVAPNGDYELLSVDSVAADFPAQKPSA